MVGMSLWVVYCCVIVIVVVGTVLVCVAGWLSDTVDERGVRRLGREAVSGSLPDYDMHCEWDGFSMDALGYLSDDRYVLVRYRVTASAHVAVRNDLIEVFQRGIGLEPLDEGRVERRLLKGAFVILSQTFRLRDDSPFTILPSAE